MLRSAGVAGAGAASLVAARRRPARAASDGREVAILGGGMAGLTAAHELLERGFRVTVYERKALGGKARSMDVHGSATGGRRGLPGEHGFRFFPGFYHHIPDTMRRIPHGEIAGRTVYDYLVDTTETMVERTEGRPNGFLFGFTFDPAEVFTPEGLQAIITKELIEQGQVPPHESAYAAERLAVFLTSSDERRFGQWEHVSWWDFIGAESRSRQYQDVAARGLTRTLVAAKEKLASTRTIGNVGEAIIYNAMGRGADGAVDRVLALPTNEAWIDPWVALLADMGVRFVLDARVNGLEVEDGRVVAAHSVDSNGRCDRITADWFVSAMPMERFRQLVTPAVLAADPSLEGLDDLFVDWMNGIQFYLRERIDFVHGHVTFADAPWALTALTQAQFWPTRDWPSDYGDGSAVDCLSVDISDWDTPGILFGKPAKQCSPEEVKAEVWAQITAHLNDRGTEVLAEDNLHSWFLDPAIGWNPAVGHNTNDEPLLVNTVSTWEKRPTAVTGIENLFLSGDFVQTDVDLATMEGANASARAAVIGLLEAAGSNAAPPATFGLYDPPEFAAYKQVDAAMYAAGLPHTLDADPAASSPSERIAQEVWIDPDPVDLDCAEVEDASSVAEGQQPLPSTGGGMVLVSAAAIAAAAALRARAGRVSRPPTR